MCTCVYNSQLEFSVKDEQDQSKMIQSARLEELKMAIFLKKLFSIKIYIKDLAPKFLALKPI